MPRSHSENENVQFVQELAEVDGPFESPININFRDLTKLELPSLVWNRSDASPSKMKITNTGHTVIISGKWKTERPYLTGGPLIGKYVFSQIHFHWGQNDTSGSEHLVSGEGFPLEMHVAHFKTDYQTQECALREKDGMVILVYLFKIQEEPNNCLRKIINSLPKIKKASTSCTLDPLPILTLCNPFTDDYFMYWGSVVTPTCAHILLWLVCREPFGISKEQVNEFRQMLDPSEAPICSNYRYPQPLHKRNVFHVNSSRNIDNPLLPIKNMIGCYCSKLNEDTKKMKPATTNCACQVYPKNQEEIEESDSESVLMSECMHANEDIQLTFELEELPDCYNHHHHHSVFVQSATVQSVPLLPETMKNFYLSRNYRKGKPMLNNKIEANSKLLSQSCGFIPTKKFIKTRPSMRRELLEPFNSKTAFSHLMDSLETLKSETCKKLKEIESINKEIKGMTFFCRNSEDKKWLQKIEKLMARQKEITLKASQGYFNELRKLARECHFDKFFDGKILSVGNNNNEIIWFNNIVTQKNFPYSDVKATGDLQAERPSKRSDKATTLIQSFFEDIQENEELQTLEKKTQFKKKNISIQEAKQAGDASAGNMGKVYITEKMFALGNFGDTFFKEVTAEEIMPTENVRQNNKNQLNEEKKKAPLTEKESSEISYKNCKNVNPLPVVKVKPEEIIPLHRANVAIKFSDIIENEKESSNNLSHMQSNMDNFNNQNISKNIQNYEKSSTEKKFSFGPEKNSDRENTTQNLTENLHNKNSNQNQNLKDKKSLKNQNQNKHLNSVPSTSTGTFTVVEAQKVIIANIQKKQTEKNFLEEKQSKSIKYAYKKPSEKKNKKQKFRNATLEELDLKKRKLINRNKKIKKGKKTNEATNPSDVSLTSNDDNEETKFFASTKLTNQFPFKITLDKSSSSNESSIIYSPISPERKKLKLESKLLNKSNYRKSEINDENVFNVLKNGDKFRGRDPFKRILQDNSRIYESRPTILVAKEDKTVQKKINIKIVTNKFENNQQVYTVSSPNSSRASGDSTNRVLKTGSYGSKTSCKDTPDIEKILEKPYEIFRAEKLTNRIEHKFSRNKSFTNLSLLHFSNRNEITRKAFIENIDDRRRSARETYEVRREMRNIKILESDEPERAKLSCKPPFTFYKKTIVTNESQKEQTNSPEKNEDFDVDALFNSKELWNSKKFIPTHFQEGLFKNKIKRCNIEKYHFLENELQESKTVRQNTSSSQEKENQEAIQKTDSNKSFKTRAPNMRGDSMATAPENEKLSPPVSFSVSKKNPTSRPHSAESLTSLKKVNKRKTKKRPHCCKRNSRHYMKKNSCVFRKLNKTENKSTQLLNLSEEEQLKIITENVAKYLKNKLAEHHQLNKLEKKSSYNIIEVALQDLKTLKPKIPDALPAVDESCTNQLSINDTEIKETKETVKVFSSNEKETSRNETKVEEKEEKQRDETPAIVKKTNRTTKPVHNFIKRNKLMAGKYKRTPSTTPIEKKEETPNKKKVEVKKNKTISQASEEKELKTRKNKSVVNQKNVSAKENKEVISEERKTKTPKKKLNSEKDKRVTKNIVYTAANEEKKNTIKKNQQFSLSLQKISPAKKNWVQPLMLASYLSTPIEILENEPNKMGRYVMNLKKTNTDNLRQENFYDDKNLEMSRNTDTIFTTDLEYLIRLQMCLNNEISANIENSMNYIKTLLNQEYNGSAIVEKAPTNNQMNCFNSNKQGVVLIEMNDLMDYSSSGSEFLEEIENQSLKITEATSKSKSLTPKESNASKLSQMENLPEKATSKTVEEMSGEEDSYSDSSYNCEISITLNTKALEEKEEAQPSQKGELNSEVLTDNFKFDHGGESNSSRTTTNTPKEEGSSSQSIQLKHTKKKRKDGQISAEMKQKLLEILEKEIKREMGATYLTSSENSSDGLALRWDESDVMMRSHQSTESGSENTEFLAQISETMRQYLREFKEKKINNCEENS